MFSIIMIRKATKYDKKELINMLCEFNKEYLPEFTEFFKEESVDKVLTSIIAGAGIALIEEGKGLILGVISPCLYDNNVNVLTELAWYAKPEYRNTTLGYRLYKEYINEANILKEQNRVAAIIICKLHNSPNINYQKHGFKKLQESWVK